MPFKKFALTIFALCGAVYCFSQENPERKGRINNNVTEVYHVSPADEQIKDGLYQAFYKRKHLIASGFYEKGKRTGIWRFSNTTGMLLQTYNFTNDSLVYEARENSSSDFHYLLDKELNDSDRVTKPMRIGDRYYGFLPYINLFKTSFYPYGDSADLYVAVVQLLISPMGRLAEYKVRVVSPYFDYDRTVTLSVKLFKEEDKQFIPATLNYEPVLSRIIIKCRVTDSGGLDFF